MDAREPAWLVAIVLAAAGALAHGPPPQELSDPLLRDAELWLDGEGALREAPPAEGFAALPASDVGPDEAVRWELTLPVRATLLGGFGATLHFRADAPVLPRVPDRALLEVSTTRNGEAAEGSTAVVPAPEAPIEPGKVYVLEARAGTEPIPAEPGDLVGLAVAFVGSAPTGSVGLLLGANRSRVALEAQLPGMEALGHEHGGWRHLRALEFEALERAPAPGPTLDLEIRHDAFERVAQAAEAGTNLTVRVDNLETPEQGAQHGLWGLDAPHVLQMKGLGFDERFRVYPGEVLVRAIELRGPGTLRFACEDGCPSPGEFATLDVRSPGANASREARVRLGPGQSHEVSVELAEGETLRWSFETEPRRPLRYDVHSHRGRETVIHDQGTSEAANGTFTAPAAGVYSLLFVNENAGEVVVAYGVEGGTEAAPAGQTRAVSLGVGLLPLALLAAAGALHATRRRRR